MTHSASRPAASVEAVEKERAILERLERIEGLRQEDAPAGVLLGSGKLANELDRLELIDEYKLLVHPRIAGHGPTLFQGGLPSTRKLELVSAKPLRCGAVAMHYRRARSA